MRNARCRSCSVTDRTGQFAACPIIADGGHSYDLEYQPPTEAP